MIKLVELCWYDDRSGYAGSKRTYLKEVSINPNHIIRMEPYYMDRNQMKLPDDLPEEQEFCLIVMVDKSDILAVGSLDQIMEKMGRAKKMLLG